MASMFFDEEHKLACKIRKKFDQLLNEHGQYCLSELLSCLVKDKDFFSDTGQLFHTSKYGNTALAEYFQHKPGVFQAFASKIGESRKLIHDETGAIYNVIQINRLDISTLKLMLCNISDLVTCFSDVKGSFRFDKNNICSNSNHNSIGKCCPTAGCNHNKNTKEGICKNCHESRRECKEKSTICCSLCGLCYYCSKSLLKPICGSHTIRESIGIITNTRNNFSHCPEKGWEDLANGSIPGKLQHLGKNWEQLWNACAKAVKCIWTYLEEKSKINTEEFEKRCYKIDKIKYEDCDEISRSKSSESKKLTFTLRFKNTSTTSLVKRLLNIAGTSHSNFQRFVNQHKGVDDPLVKEVESILTKILLTQLSLTTFETNNFKIECTEIRSAPLRDDDYFELSVIIKQNSGTVRELFEEYNSKDSEKSKSLWTQFTDKIKEYTHQQMGLKVEIYRDKWKCGSIKLLLKMFKQDQNMWKETEKSAVLQIIQALFAEHFPIFTVVFKNDEYFSRSDNNVLEMKFFTKNVSDPLTEKSIVKIELNKFEEKIKEEIELLRKKDITWKELFTSYDVEVKKFRLRDLNPLTQEIEALSIIADEEVVRTEAARQFAQCCCSLVEEKGDSSDGFLICFGSSGIATYGILMNIYFPYSELMKRKGFDIVLHNGELVHVKLTSATFYFTCPFLDVSFFKLEEDFVERMKQTNQAVFLPVNDRYVRRGTEIYSMYESLHTKGFKSMYTTIDSCWGLHICYDQPEDPTIDTPKAAMVLNGYIEAIYQNIDKSGKTKALRISAVTRAVTILLENNVKGNILPHAPAKPLDLKEFRELDAMRLLNTRNPDVFVSPSSFMVTPLWFYRTNHSWYWTPMEPKTLDDIAELRYCNWISIGKDRSMKVIGGTWQDLEPAKRNINLIKKLAESGLKYLQ